MRLESKVPEVDLGQGERRVHKVRLGLRVPPGLKAMSDHKEPEEKKGLGGLRVRRARQPPGCRGSTGRPGTY